MSNSQRRTLKLSYSGKIIDHLGIQMYQSPVAAIAELVSNSWDADATKVFITLPDVLSNEAEIVLKDDGIGMTFDDCEKRYLNVGYCRRGANPESYSPAGRPILGRKGIGKFAGFGIAEKIVIETISKNNGEKTVFALDINELRGDEYVTKGSEIDVIEYLPPDENRKNKHGTIVHLKILKLARRRSPDQFAMSMSRRFLLHQRVDDFKVYVNEKEIPESDELENIEYTFPGNYEEGKIPEGLVLENGWAKEKLSNGKEIGWRIHFYKDPISDEEFRGISIFANGKIAQKPFFFQLSGGLSGQHGQQYISGKVEANYIDQLRDELITTDRQELNWEHTDARPLLEWGEKKVKELLSLWKELRGEKRKKQLQDRISGFSYRLDMLRRPEKLTVERALRKIGSIPTLSDDQFEELGSAILTAWEQGRLRQLISEISYKDDFTTDEFINLLSEANVLTALNMAEVVETKIRAIEGLENMIKNRELENKIRDHIANHPWLLDPQWETFVRELSVTTILKNAAIEVGFDNDLYKGRIDLALKSGDRLFVIEFMKPGLTLDRDHIHRCQDYIASINGKVLPQTLLGFREVIGLIVADRIEKGSTVRTLVDYLKKIGITACDWNTLLDKSKARWNEFLEIIKSRAPEDQRLQSIDKPAVIED